MTLSNATYLEEVEDPIKAVAIDLSRRATLSNEVGHPSLLRGVPFQSLVNGFGIHFKARNLASASFTEEESEELYATSREVKVLDGFVSHSWRSSRSGKVLALLVHGNLVGASIVSGVVAVVVAILQYQKVLPVMTFLVPSANAVGSSFSYQYFPWVYILGFSSFLISFIYWHVIPHRLGFEKDYFFDKLCVHQFDEDRKLAGILSVAAYVHNTDKFLLLWDINYFKRLWCTLEMAALAKAHDLEDLPLVFLPTGLATASFIGWLMAYSFGGILFIMEATTGQRLPNTLHFVCGMVLFLGTSHVTRRYWQQRTELNTLLAQFTVSATECFLEKDRELVNRTLIEWFGSLGKFDEHVQTTIKHKFISAVGQQLHFPLKYTWPFFLIKLYHEMDYFACGYYRQLQQATSLGTSEALASASWTVLLLTVAPCCMHVAKVGATVEAKFGEERWKIVVVLMTMTVANTTYYFGCSFVTYAVFASLPAYVPGAMVVLSVLWFAFLQRDSFRHRGAVSRAPRDSFRKRRTPSAHTVSGCQDAACRVQNAIGAACRTDFLEDSKVGKEGDSPRPPHQSAIGAATRTDFLEDSKVGEVWDSPRSPRDVEIPVFVTRQVFSRSALPRSSGA